MIAPKKSEAEIALDILIERREPVFYRELITEIARLMGRREDAATLTSIYTRLNMDNRLVYQSDGYWFFDPNRVRRG